MDPEFLSADPSDHVHDDSVNSVSWSFPGLELNVNKLWEWIGSLMKEFGTSLFRYKGVLAVKGCEEKWIFQGVHMLFTGGFTSEVLGGSGYARKKNKWVQKDKARFWQPDEQRECRFVFIGKGIKEHGERLRKEFLECAAEESLRFKVGDAAEARVAGGWKPVTVTKLWDEGYPYRLKVRDGEETFDCWGPMDDDRFVRAPEK